MKNRICIQIIVLCVLVSAGTCLTAQAKYKPLPSQVSKPDLTAKIGLSYTTHINSNGIKCYTVTPTITLINKGNATARKFKWKVEWIHIANTKWSYFSQGTTSLGPGSTKDMGGEASWNLTWCVNEPTWKPAWKVILDEEEKFNEFKEDNNIIIKIFTPPRKKIKPPLRKP